MLALRGGDWLKLPLWAVGVAGTDKSFVKNRLIGDPDLNQRGLHRARVRLAARMAERRRASLARVLDPADRAAFDRDGFIVKEDFLPQATFDRLRQALITTPLPAREMRQGQAVTRMIPLPPDVIGQVPDLASVVRNPAVDDLIRYVGGGGGDPIYFIQTVIAEPSASPHDPQTELHADTFHSTSKMWLFLQDVGEDDGPFTFVPGSHRLTPERLEWEYRTSLTASADDRTHHRFGSFRIRPEELRQLGDFTPRRVTVKANTMVIADTFAFHARTPSPKPTLRTEIHGYLRGNPFVPWTRTAGSLVPGLRDRRLDFYLRYKDAMAARGRGGQVWKSVGLSTADAPAHI